MKIIKLKIKIMKKITLLFAFVFVAFAMNAQITVFEDNFDDEDISDWTQFDVDGDGNTFISYFPDGNPSPYMTSQSWTAATGPLTPNNYSFSIPIDASGVGDLTLTYQVGGQDPAYSEEVYTVFVTTASNPDDITTDNSVMFMEDLGDDPAAAGALVDRSLDATALAGEDIVYVVFRHHDVTDQFYINFDNVSLTGTELGLEDQVFNGFSQFVDRNNTLNLSATTAMNNITIVNSLGQTVISQRLSNTDETVNLSNLSNGVYIANVTIDGANKSFKIIRK